MKICIKHPSAAVALVPNVALLFAAGTTGCMVRQSVAAARSALPSTIAFSPQGLLPVQWARH